MLLCAEADCQIEVFHSLIHSFIQNMFVKEPTVSGFVIHTLLYKDPDEVKWDPAPRSNLKF